MRTLLLAILAGAVFGLVPAVAPGDPQPQFAERLHRPGLHRLGRIHAGLYRGSHPEGEDGYASLRALGIKTVISLRPSRDDPQLRERYGLGIRSIPISPKHPPTPRQQREFLSLVTDTGLQPIYVHCALGRDRTGVMMALYRIHEQGWSANDAIAEMRYFGHAYREYPELEKFIRRLPAAPDPAPVRRLRTIDFIGHRGYSAQYPENTLLSLEEAFKRGVKYCEIDVNVTKDDVYVLFHDQPTMYRTTNGRGYIQHSYYADLLKLDFGRWKGEEFSGTPVTTLKDAMLLAEKYGAYLYLDTKVFRPDLLGKLLRETGVSPDRILPSLYTLAEAAEFRKYCPDSPWVWFGGLPDDPGDDTWYAERIALGCSIFECYYTKALASDGPFPVFREKVHGAGAKIWVFTVNSPDEATALARAGVDGMETDNAPALIEYFKGINLDEGSAGHADDRALTAPDRRTTANYLFEKPGLFSTGIGSQLRPLAYYDTGIIQTVSFGTTAEYGISPINGYHATVMKVPAFNPANGLMLFPNFLPGRDEELHYDYTILLDMYIPAPAENKMMSLFQTNPDNTNDGDMFIDMKRGFGIANEYHGVINPDTWYRLAIAVSRTSIKKYMNGVFAGENRISGGRWAAINTSPGGQNQGFLLFADEDSETLECYVHAIQVRNYAMSGDEVLTLGAADPGGIPINNTGIYMVTASGETGTGSVVNWDEHTIVTTFPENHDTSMVTVNFKTSYRATASIQSGSTFDFRSDTNEIIITAEDGITRTAWKIMAVK